MSEPISAAELKEHFGIKSGSQALEVAGRMQMFASEQEFNNWAKEIYDQCVEAQTGKDYAEAQQIMKDGQARVNRRRLEISHSNNEILFKIMKKVDGQHSDALKWCLAKNPDTDIEAWWKRRLAPQKIKREDKKNAKRTSGRG